MKSIVLNKKRILISAGLLCILPIIIIAVLTSSRTTAEGPQEPTAPQKTPTVANSPTFTPLPPTATPVPSQIPTATPVPIPESYYIEKISGHRQVYALGCETSAAVDWARFFGTSIYEYDFQAALPHSDNPDYGFVGDVNSEWGQIPPYAYGVYAGPVADLLVQYGLPAKAVKNFTLDEVKKKLSEGTPIIVWVIGNMVWSSPSQYTDSQGRTTVVAPYEHVVVLTGYDEDTIRYMTNGRFYDTPTEVFLTSWGVLENMAVIYEDQEE